MESQEAATAAEQTNDFAIPQEYQDRGWTKTVDSNEALWKSLDNAQSMLGKRPAGIPENDAPQEDWDKFYQASGRPEEASKYELTPIEGLPEGVDLTSQTEAAAGLFHKHGLSQKQAEGLYKDWLGLEMESTVAKSAELDKSFDEITAKHFGDTFEADQKLTLDMAARLVPEELRPAFASLEGNPAALAAIVSLAKGANEEINAIKQKYGAEDAIASGGQSTPGVSVIEVRKELAQLRTSDAARNFDHPDHETTRAKIEELSGTVRRLIK